MDSGFGEVNVDFTTESRATRISFSVELQRSEAKRVQRDKIHISTTQDNILRPGIMMTG